MMSLYDYTGKKDENGMGLKVHAYSILRKQPFKQRELDLPTYKGKVFLYTREFLHEFFEVNKIENEFLTLYNYLGKASGKELGRVVCIEAVKLGELIKEIPISNPKYEGNVHAYRREFLDKYFKNN